MKLLICDDETDRAEDSPVNEAADLDRVWNSKVSHPEIVDLMFHRRIDRVVTL